MWSGLIQGWARKSADRPRRLPATCARWRGSNVPVIAVITGEGGSGGALAIAVADRVLMMENSIYSVISPGRLRVDHVA